MRGRRLTFLAVAVALAACDDGEPPAMTADARALDGGGPDQSPPDDRVESAPAEASDARPNDGPASDAAPDAAAADAASLEGAAAPADAAPDVPVPAVVSLAHWTYIEVDKDRAPAWHGYGNFGLGFGDVDGDGFPEIVSGHYLYANPRAPLTARPFSRTTLPLDPTNGRTVDASLLFDAEGNGRQDDILAEALPNVLWLKPANAQATSFVVRVIAQMPPTFHDDGRTAALVHVYSAHARPDILLSGGGGTFVLSIPANPEKDPWPIVQVTTALMDEQKSLGTGDFDSDGHIDLAAPLGVDQLRVAWWRNSDDPGRPWDMHVIGDTDAEAKMVAVGDVNLDGRLDVVVTEEATPSKVYWFEGPPAPWQTPWRRHVVKAGLAEIDSLSLADMNRDGRPDIVVGETLGDKRVIIFENRADSPTDDALFTEHVIDSGKESHNGARAIDLDADGILDIVSIGYYDYKYLRVWRNEGG